MTPRPRRSHECVCGRRHRFTPDARTRAEVLTAMRWAGWCFAFDPGFA